MTITSNTVDSINKENWRDELAVKNTDCSSRGPRLDAQHSQGGSLLSVTLIPGTLPSSFDFHQHQRCLDKTIPKDSYIAFKELPENSGTKKYNKQ